MCINLRGLSHLFARMRLSKVAPRAPQCVRQTSAALFVPFVQTCTDVHRRLLRARDASTRVQSCTLCAELFRRREKGECLARI